MGENVRESVADWVYSYLRTHAELGAHPHQIARVLGLPPAMVIEALQELAWQGRIHLRSTNIEWKGRYIKREK